jgi:hypothetical protein
MFNKIRTSSELVGEWCARAQDNGSFSDADLSAVRTASGAEQERSTRIPWIYEGSDGFSRHIQAEFPPNPIHLRTLTSTQFDELYIAFAREYPASAVRHLCGIMHAKQATWKQSTDHSEFPKPLPPDLNVRMVSRTPHYIDHKGKAWLRLVARIQK